VINVRDSYGAFLRAKRVPGVKFRGDFAILPEAGTADPDDKAAIASIAHHLHEYQRFATAFATARRRAALFLECGLGKTSIALAWSEAMRANGPAVIAAPLAALHEFENERDRFFSGVPIELVPSGDFGGWLRSPSGIALVTHHAFIQPRDLSGVRAFVLDESSILKSGDGAIASGLIESTRHIDAKLALSATPAPNDPTEYATHATWLGYVKADAEFVARFFVRDGKFWRPKGHAREELPKWLSKFALWMRRPEAYGMPCAALPAADYTTEIHSLPSVASGVHTDLLGVPVDASMSDRATIRRACDASPDRMGVVVHHAAKAPSIVWALRNSHADACEREIRAAGVKVAQIAGRTSDEDRVRIIREFQAGELDCIVAKPKVIGHGVNLQRADVMVFAAYNESYESHHQAVRRAHRQGRIGTLHVVMPMALEEQRVIATLRRKGAEWERTADEQEAAFTSALAGEVATYRDTGAVDATETHRRDQRMDSTRGEHYWLANDDSIRVMRDDMAPESVDLAVFSPPFSALFTYSSQPEDLGNCSEHDNDAEFSIHFAHFADALLRVMKQGRVVCLHLQQLIAFRAKHGRKGLRDFRGMVIGRMEAAGFHYYGEFVVSKNPQATAIRTKSERLQFTQFKRDSLESSPCLNDYVLQFRKPGKQAVKVLNDVSNDEWIRWASGIWGDIRESDVLQGWQKGRDPEDEKHICPLQLEVIRRCVRLWTNPGEIVFTPFAGIGSEVYVAIEQKRIGWGIELKPAYYRQAVCNADAAVERTHKQQDLFAVGISAG